MWMRVMDAHRKERTRKAFQMRQPLDDPHALLDALLGDESAECEPGERRHSFSLDQIVDRLLDIILIGDELLACLQEEEASPFLWIEPHLERVCREADAVLKRVAN
jgi:hypothetical protein